MNLPLRWDRAERRRRHGGTVEAEHNAVGVKSPHAGIHHAGPHVRYMDAQSIAAVKAARPASLTANLIQPSRSRFQTVRAAIGTS